MRHMTGAVYGIMPGPVHLDRGTQMAGIVMDELRFDPARGFAGGYELETLPGFGLAGVAANMSPGAWGREYAEDIEQYRNVACMWIVGEDMPQASNGVTLHPTEKDQYGLPVPVVHFKDHPNDIAMRNHAFKAGGDIYRAAGATRVYERMPFSSTHNMGTCRQSAESAGRGLQRLRPDPRRRQSVHLGRQPVHDRRGREPDAHDRGAGDPPGGVHRRSDEQRRRLTSLARKCDRARAPARAFSCRSGRIDYFRSQSRHP